MCKKGVTLALWFYTPDKEVYYLYYPRNRGLFTAGVWVDIPKFLIYGYNPPKPTFPSARRLTLVDPRVVNRFDTILLDLMHQHDLFHRMEYLHN